MLYIDGSEGEGGGQVLRTSLALSICLRIPFRIENIRARRKKPGLLRQHLTAVKAAARICNADVEGDYLGSKVLQFEPNAVQSGQYHFAINSAGSVNLVLQTIMIPLLFAEDESEVVVEGGTHNPLAPPFEFLEMAYLPVLDAMGGKICATLERPGFFPAGGGRLVVNIVPSRSLKPVVLNKRSELIDISGKIYLAGLSGDIAEREIKVLAKRSGISVNKFKSKFYTTEYGPANVLIVTVECENATEVFVGYGQKGVKAEIVAKRLATDILNYLKSDVFADEHLADQLLLPVVLAGAGEFSTNAVSSHFLTNVNVIKKFMDIAVNIEETSERHFHIQIKKII